MAVDPSLYPDIEGSTDSEALFFLALTFGLTDDPFAAVARAVGLVEKVGREHGVEYPVQMTVATTDGDSVWAFRYSSEGKSRSLFFSTDVSTLRQLHPEVEMLRGLGEETRLVVSEPLGDLPGAWNEVPESSAGVVRPGTDEIRPFEPVAREVSPARPAGRGWSRDHRGEKSRCALLRRPPAAVCSVCSDQMTGRSAMREAATATAPVAAISRSIRARR